MFFTGLNRKIMEEKRDFSFEMDYFHNKAGKGENRSLNKVYNFICPTYTCSSPEVVKYFSMM